MLRELSLAGAFLATIPAANWMIGNVGTVCVPNGPCLLPMWPGIMAPSGVLIIGLALVLRDALPTRTALIAIAVGAALSAFVAPPALVVASVVAFLVGELADLAVFAPLRDRRLWLAVALSGVIGAAVDSVLFLLLAFGNLDYLAGQMIGKVEASIVAALYLYTRKVASPEVKP